MNIAVVYDSVYGNTEKIAQSVAAALGPAGTVKLVRAANASPADIAGLGLLVVGAPTQGGRGTPAVQAFLAAIPGDGLTGIRVAVFDTRMRASAHGAMLRLLMKTIGYAAGKIEKDLKSKGGVVASPAEGFFVKGREGPLEDGEAERAVAWAKKLATA